MEDKENSQSNKVFLILAVILLVLSGILAWQLYEQKEANQKLALEKQQLTIEKDELTDELDVLLGKYAGLEDENGVLSAELEEQKSLIEELKGDVEKYKGDAAKLSWYRSQLKAMNEKYETMEAQYDSLFAVHDSLQGEFGNLEGEYTRQTGLNSELTSENMNLANKVAMGSVLTAYKIAVEGVRGKKEKVNNKASRIEKLRICFTLSENPIAKAGSKTVYVRIVGPDGKVLTKGRGEEFEFEGGSMTYSISEKIEYTNAQIEDLCLYYVAPTTKFVSGKHTIEIYIDKSVIGTAAVSLR
ncbi:MAG: Tfp pilus assembly protein PilO [Bacteroidia bacterium]|jgi:Tfp pilus assembly protein PilO